MGSQWSSGGFPVELQLSSSWHGLHVDLGEADVVEDVEHIDGSQVADPVMERQDMRVVDGDLKLFVGAQDLHLQRKNNIIINNLLFHRSALNPLHGVFGPTAWCQLEDQFRPKHGKQFFAKRDSKQSQCKDANGQIHPVYASRRTFNPEPTVGVKLSLLSQTYRKNFFWSTLGASVPKRKAFWPIWSFLSKLMAEVNIANYVVSLEESTSSSWKKSSQWRLFISLSK